MSKTTISMRIEDGLLEKADALVAAGSRENRTQVLELGAAREVGMDPAIRAVEDEACLHLGLTPLGFQRGLYADWKARQVAFERAWGHKNPEPLHEFSKVAGGETGAQLIERLTVLHEQRELQRRYGPLAQEARSKGLVPPGCEYSDVLIGQLYDQVLQGVLTQDDFRGQLENPFRLKWTASDEPAKSLSELDAER